MNKYRSILATLLLILFTGIVAGDSEAYQVPQAVQEKAAQYTRMAKEMMASGRITDAVKLMRLAIDTNPVDPTLRMNYVTVMSRKGERSLMEGKRREAIVVFKNVEKELLSAAKLFKDAGATANAAYALQQVGQIYRHVYSNEATARGYFNKALEIDPAAAQNQPS